MLTMLLEDLLGFLVERFNRPPNIPRRHHQATVILAPIPVKPDGVSFAEANQQAYRMCQELLPLYLWQQLVQEGQMKVPSPSNPNRTYVIAQKGTVSRYEYGRKVNHCIAPDVVFNLPPLDRAFAHYCHIIGNEDEYLSVANTNRHTT